jgi:hypothetical protein
MTIGEGTLDQAVWYTAMSDTTRSNMRQEGRRVLDEIRRYLAAGFLYFSDFVINAILTWSELAQPRDSSEWANLLRQVNTFIHTMLLSIIEYYEAE